jgi:ABC-type Na+ efflux pump permease subunit
VRETHRLSDGQTIVTVVAGWLLVFIVTAIVSGIFGLGALGMGAMFGR